MQYTINKIESRQFAELSGDFNPIHLDGNYSRRSIVGTTIVHGMHIFLRGVEILMRTRREGNLRYHLSFLQGLQQDKQFVIRTGNDLASFEISDKSGVTYLKATSSTDLLDEIEFVPSDHMENSKYVQWPIDFQPADVKHNMTVPLPPAGNASLVQTLFPNLVKTFGADLISEVAWSSSLIGMSVPGLNSLLMSADLQIKQNPNTSTNAFVTRFDERFNVVQLRYDGINMTMNFRAIFRPIPVSSPSMMDIVSASIGLPKMTGRRVLVIGASRGIGAATTLLCAHLGAEVIATFRSGQHEIDEVIRKLSFVQRKRTKIQQFDVTDQSNWHILESSYDYVFYFATPKIFRPLIGESVEERQSLFNFYFCTQFERIVRRLWMAQRPTVVSPSTVAIDSPSQLLTEYSKAKLASEVLSQKLMNELNGTIVMPRLGRTLTDQTNSSLKIDSYSAVESARCLLVSLKRWI